MGLRSWIVKREETASAYIQWLSIDLDASTAPFLAMAFHITLHELRIECFFPADEASAAVLRGA